MIVILHRGMMLIAPNATAAVAIVTHEIVANATAIIIMLIFAIAIRVVTRLSADEREKIGCRRGFE
jgi:hypothetical protein